MDSEFETTLQSPSELYLTVHWKENESTEKYNLEWKLLNENTKIKYIKASVKLSKGYIKNETEVKGKKLDATLIHSCCKLSRIEKDLYGRCLSKKRPSLPLSDPCLFYYKESGLLNEALDLNISEKLMQVEAERYFGKLNEEQQYSSYKEQIQEFERYIDLEKRWKKSLDQFDLFIYNDWSKRDLMKNEIHFRKQIWKKLPKVKKSIPMNEIPKMNISTFPPLQPYHLVARLWDDRLEEAMTLYKTYSLMKYSYSRITVYIREKFAKDTLAYVENLSPKHQAFFVGLNRKLFMSKYLGEDIFEKSFPAKYYPIICNTIRRQKKYEEDDENVKDLVPENFDPYDAIQMSTSRLVLLVDYDLNSDYDSS